MSDAGNVLDDLRRLRSLLIGLDVDCQDCIVCQMDVYRD